MFVSQFRLARTTIRIGEQQPVMLRSFDTNIDRELLAVLVLLLFLDIHDPQPGIFLLCSFQMLTAIVPGTIVSPQSLRIPDRPDQNGWQNRCRFFDSLRAQMMTDTGFVSTTGCGDFQGANRRYTNAIKKR